MRKNSRNFDLGSDEINIYDFFSGLKKYWQRFVLVFVVALGCSYAYFLKTLPAPHSQVAVKVGFNSIRASKYPDGSFFNQTDLINDSIVKAAFNNISEVKNANKWSPDSIRNALLITPIYPLEIRMAKGQLSNENAKTPPAELLANYNKVMYYNANEFIITFSPVPAMPLKLQERLLSEIVKQYSDYALHQHIPFSMMDGDYIGDALLAQGNYYPAYEYFSRIVKAIDDLAARVNLQDNAESSHADYRMDNRMDTRMDNRMDTRTDNRLVSLNGMEAKIKSIRAELGTVEYAIFDDKGFPDSSLAKRMLEMEIADARVALDIKKKQAEYKVYLASLPMSGLPKDRGAEGSERPGDVKNNAIVDILLTYNNQYYRLIGEADAINSDIANLQIKLARLQENLKRIDTPYAGNLPLETRTKNLVAALEKTNDSIKGFLAGQAAEIRAFYTKNQPPIMNSFFLEHAPAMPMGKVISAAFGITLAFGVFQIVGYIVNLVAERQRSQQKSSEISSVQTPQINRKS